MFVDAMHTIITDQGQDVGLALLECEAGGCPSEEGIDDFGLDNDPELVGEGCEFFFCRVDYDPYSC